MLDCNDGDLSDAEEGIFGAVMADLAALTGGRS